MCALTIGSMIYGGAMAAISAIGTATASVGSAVGATMAAGATAMGVGATAAGVTGGVAAGLTSGALNGALVGTATGAIAGAATGRGAGRGALVGGGIGAAGGALLSGAGMALNGVQVMQAGAANPAEAVSPTDWSMNPSWARGDVRVMTGGITEDARTVTEMNGQTFRLVTDSTGEHWVPASSGTGGTGASAKASAEAGLSPRDLASAGIRAAGQGISSGIQGYGAMEQGKADAEALKDQAKLKEFQAKTELENAEIAKRDRMRQFRQMRGQGRASAAANGMLVEGDNVATWEQDLAGEAAYDSWKIGENARRTAWGYRQEAKVLNKQAAQARRTGNLKAAGAWISAPFQMFGAGASLLA